MIFRNLIAVSLFLTAFVSPSAHANWWDSSGGNDYSNVEPTPAPAPVQSNAVVISAPAPKKGKSIQAQAVAETQPAMEPLIVVQPQAPVVSAPAAVSSGSGTGSGIMAEVRDTMQTKKQKRAAAKAAKAAADAAAQAIKDAEIAAQIALDIAKIQANAQAAATAPAAPSVSAPATVVAPVVAAPAAAATSTSTQILNSMAQVAQAPVSTPAPGMAPREAAPATPAPTLVGSLGAVYTDASGKMDGTYFNTFTPKAAPRYSQAELNAKIGQVVNGILIQGIGGQATWRPGSSKQADTSDFTQKLDVAMSGLTIWKMDNAGGSQESWLQNGFAFRNGIGDYGRSERLRVGGLDWLKNMESKVAYSENAYERNLKSWMDYEACILDPVIREQIGSCDVPSAPRERSAFFGSSEDLVSKEEFAAQKKMWEIEFIKLVEQNSAKEYVKNPNVKNREPHALMFPMACNIGHANGEANVDVCEDGFNGYGFGKGLYSCLMSSIATLPADNKWKECKQTLESPATQLVFKTYEACADEFYTYCSPFQATRNDFQACMDYVSLRGFQVSKACNDQFREFTVQKFGAISVASIPRYPENQGLPASGLTNKVVDQMAELAKKFDRDLPNGCVGKGDDGQLPLLTGHCVGKKWGEGLYQCLIGTTQGPVPPSSDTWARVGAISCRLMLHNYSGKYKFYEACANDIKQFCVESELDASLAKPCAAKVARLATAGSTCQTVAFDYGVTNFTTLPPTVTQATVDTVRDVGITIANDLMISGL